MPAFIAPANCRYDYEYDWICIWDRIKNLCHLKWPEIMLSIFKHAHRFLRWWALCTKHVNFPAFCRCESILGRKSTHIILSFHVPFMFLSCSFHFAFISFHVPFMFLSFCIHFLSCSVAMYQCIKHTGLWKAVCSNRSGGYPPKRLHVFHIIILPSFWRPVQVAIFRVHELSHIMLCIIIQLHVPSGYLT